MILSGHLLLFKSYTPLSLQGSRAEAVETLLAIEKVQRLAEDVTGTRLACTAVLEILYAAKDWPGLNEHIILLSKRRSQLKQVQSVRM